MEVSASSGLTQITVTQGSLLVFADDVARAYIDHIVSTRSLRQRSYESVASSRTARSSAAASRRKEGKRGRGKRDDGPGGQPIDGESDERSVDVLGTEWFGSHVLTAGGVVPAGGDLGPRHIFITADHVSSIKVELGQLMNAYASSATKRRIVDPTERKKIPESRVDPERRRRADAVDGDDSGSESSDDGDATNYGSVSPESISSSDSD